MHNCLTLVELEALALAAPDSWPASSTQHLQTCPSCRRELDEIRADLQLFDACRRAGLDSVRPVPADPSVMLPAAGDRPAHAPVIPGFEILEEVHRGAQGVVYKAIQQSAKRTVALKVMLHGPYASRREKHRFEREIEIVGALDHPNIVTLHESGQIDGRHYFAMQYVDGLPLLDHVAASNPPVVEVLRLFARICRAIAYAHRRGIIHRDLKPGNIRVDPAGEPHVLDFGLARPVDVGMAAGSLATHTGEFLGTLAYASPEQVSGNPHAIDTRSDVYALGVILYELLTGRPPYPVTGSMSEVLRSITEVEPKTPSHFNRRLGNEIDTIVLKAVAKNPDRRYPSAEALARDIDRYLAGQPIEAKADSGWYVLRKNLLRHRIAVAFAASLFVVVTCALIVSLTFWRQAIAQRDAAQSARLAEQEQRRIAAANFQKARDAVDQMLTEVGEQSLENVPHMTPVRKALLEKALAFYQGLTNEQSREPVVRYETARAYRRVADLARMLGQLERAREADDQGIALLEKLSAEFPDNAEYQSELAHALFLLGVMLKNEIGDKPAALTAYRRSFDLRARLAARFPDVADRQRDLASTHVDLGLVLSDLEHHSEALEQLRRGVALREQLAARFPSVPEYRDDLAHAHHWLGSRLKIAGRPDEVEQHLRESLALRAELVTQSPGNQEYRYNLAHIQEYLGTYLLQSGRLPESETFLRQAIANQKKLVIDFPDVVEHRKHLATNYECLSVLLLTAGKHDEAEESMRQCLHLRRDLAAEVPQISTLAKDLAMAHYNLGVLLYRVGQSIEAADHFRQAFAHLERLTAEFPEQPAHVERLAGLLVTCPDPQFHDANRAIALAGKALDLRPDSPSIHQILGLACCRTSRWRQAVNALNKATEDGNTWFFLAMAHWQLGNRQEARTWYEKAVAWMKQNKPGDMDLRTFRAEAAALLGLSGPPTSAPTNTPATTQRHQ